MVAVVVVAVLLVMAYVTYKTFYGKLVAAEVKAAEAKVEETVTALVTDVKTEV
jgi:Tfp pilus assembly protein PilE